jgi:hypothetical protein
LGLTPLQILALSRDVSLPVRCDLDGGPSSPARQDSATAGAIAGDAIGADGGKDDIRPWRLT